MAGLVNATLFVQITNFIITYVFLHRIFFKPFVELIDKKEAAKQSLLTKLKDKEVLLRRLQEEKAVHLDNFKKTIKKTYTLSPPAQSKQIPPATGYSKDNKEYEELLKMTTTILEKKVPDVF